jgi:hypothetical protein
MASDAATHFHARRKGLGNERPPHPTTLKA